MSMTTPIFARLKILSHVNGTVSRLKRERIGKKNSGGVMTRTHRQGSLTTSTGAAAEQRERDYTVGLAFSGPFWQMREWCGMEGLCIMMIEQPEFVLDMVAFWQDFVLQNTGAHPRPVPSGLDCV